MGTPGTGASVACGVIGLVTSLILIVMGYGYRRAIAAPQPTPDS